MSDESAWGLLAADRDKWKSEAGRQGTLATNWLKRIKSLEEEMADARKTVGHLRKVFGCKEEIFNAYGELVDDHGDLTSDLECLRQLVVSAAMRPSSEAHK